MEYKQNLLANLFFKKFQKPEVKYKGDYNNNNSSVFQSYSVVRLISPNTHKRIIFMFISPSGSNIKSMNERMKKIYSALKSLQVYA